MSILSVTHEKSGRAALPLACTVGQLMTEPLVTVHADHTIVEAARHMTRHPGGRVPVDEANRILGVVTRRDLRSM